MEEAGTDPLRALAPQWSLAGDDKLLTILQNTHQKILTKSQEVNSKLEEMVAGLNDAGISLQNVNNKFMALSNSQFIESRVYDDDADMTTEIKQMKEQPKPPTAESELTMLKRSLSVLESMHEVVTILRDSDTESDSDDDAAARVVMKPKDLYASRPLPYIIGSQAWKNKWHAGLLVEDSDSDSSTSKPDRESEQYSDSEPEPDVEPEGNIQTDKLHLPDQTISETSSDLASEQETPTPAIVKPSPSDVAAELARRLGGQLPKQQEHAPAEYVAPRPTVKTVYRPHQPTPGTIFSDEPPPIDQQESSSSTEEDGDIFAELHKKQPYKQSSTDNSRLTDDLFDFSDKNDGDIFSHFAAKKVPIPIAKPKPTLFEDEPEPELFAPKPETEPLKNNVSMESDTGAIKKPVGGISLFGTNKGAESIGAAILKRNQRKSSSNDDSESDEPIKPQAKPIVQTKNIDPIKPVIKVAPVNEPVKKEKDIFDDLFAKSDKLQKKEPEDKVKKVDLFSDNLFDDIDDIFSTNVVKTSTKTNKPIFDDDDDLFADVAIEKTIGNDKRNEKKGLFDTDDDLFTEKDKIETKTAKLIEERDIIKSNDSKLDEKPTSVFENTKVDNISSYDEFSKTAADHKSHLNKSAKVNEVIKQSKSIFDDDSNDTDIFSSLKTSDRTSTKLEIERLSAGGTDNNKTAINSDNVKCEESNSVEVNKITEVTKVIKETRSIFDDDSDSDIFANNKTTPKYKTDITQTKFNLGTEQNNKITENDLLKNKNESQMKSTDRKNEKLTFRSSSLLDDNDDENEELFTKSKESIIDNKKVMIDVVKVNSASNVLQTSHIVKETIVTHENNEQTDILSPVSEGKPKIVATKVIDTPIKNIFSAEMETAAEPPPFEIQSTVHLADEKIESKTQEPFIFNDDIPAPDPEDDTSFAADKDLVLSKPDIFSAIFTEPPVFEKLKEPKGSQNVNALFGDDSDDEALFFKKDEVVSDDKPDIFVPNANTDMFGIFVDEPPAIDIDFVTQSYKNDGIFDSNDDLYPSIPKYQDIENKEDTKTAKAMEPGNDKNKKLPKSILDDSSSEIDKIDVAQAVDSENKKIGKLKTMNFNIDVNTLLPGGSPKKKLIEQVDGQAVFISNEELPTNGDTVEPKMVKSVSFEGKPDSEVLDNKLSKERAKIQVKRRPSTRRARREAVRKSALDLDNDSTDNSSSIDDLPKSRPVPDKLENKPDSSLNKTENDDLTKTRDVKSKVVYILHDEDIFDTKPDANKQVTDVNKTKLDDVDSNNSHKTKDFQKKDLTDGISILGNVYKEKHNTPPTTLTEKSNSSVKTKEAQAVHTKSSLFGELSEDDELFSKNKATVKKINIFESDSDDDLFTGKSKSKKETVERKREVVVKGSLFGDDDDDDDLFGVKTKKITEPIPQSSKPTSRETTKSSEPVFDDPLSMLEDDD